jgi:RNA polymerase sigma-54 factor
MDLKHGLHMRMSQQLVMTPRLQMALKILQVSTLELEQFLKQELLQNPLLDRLEDEETELEKDESEQDGAEEKERAEEKEGAEEKERAEDEGQGDEAAEPEAEKAESSEEKDESAEDLDWDDYLDDVYSHASGQNFARDDDDDRFERVPVAVATFEDELKHQLHMESENDALIGIAEYIIDELDSYGYVNDTLEEIAAALKVDVERVAKALALVQALDPAGIAARTIEECLLLQLQRKGLGDTLAARVVSTSFEELKSCRYDAIRRKLSVSTDELREAIGEVAKLDPRPRIDPVVGDPGYITPDLVIDEIDGDFIVYLNDQDVPRVRINPTYRRILSSGAASEEREFISKKLKAHAAADRR